MATEEQVKNLLTLIEDCTVLEIDHLIHNPDWGSINFVNAKTDLERLYSLCNHFKVLPLEQLPDDVAVHIHQQGTPIKNTIEQIRKFTIEQANPSGVRDNLVSHVKAHTDQFYKAAHIYIPYLAYQKGEIQQNIKELTMSVQQASELLKSSRADVQQKKREIDEIVRAARDASASVGVAHFTGDFQTEHSSLEVTAKKWLIATTSLAIVTLIAGLFFWHASPNLPTTISVVHYVTTKFIILGVLITATVWCGNIYKAIKHQSAINKFKANSLKTFQAFIKAAEDNSVRDAVLIETTRAIFSEGATGYIGGDTSRRDNNTTIVELLKNSMLSTKINN